MSATEFDLIQTYFTDCGAVRADVALGVGDDAALLRTPPDRELVLTQDTLVEGVHFLPGSDPEGLGHKALAVNLSDLAAMGAEPAWVTLALTLPRVDAIWLSGFARGFCALARKMGARLVGGDTCRGPLNISVAAHGLVPAGRALRRDGARSGDDIYVTGTLGDAGLGLRHLRDGLVLADAAQACLRLERPEPRLSAGLALRGLATAAIDISDGLMADLGHILEKSRVGAELELERLPCSGTVRDYLSRTADWSQPLAAGDDYELCFTLPPAQAGRLVDFPCVVTRVGRIEQTPGLRIHGPDGTDYHPAAAGYEHFSTHG